LNARRDSPSPGHLNRFHGRRIRRRFHPLLFRAAFRAFCVRAARAARAAHAPRAAHDSHLVVRIEIVGMLPKLGTHTDRSATGAPRHRSPAGQSSAALGLQSCKSPAKTPPAQAVWHVADAMVALRQQTSSVGQSARSVHVRAMPRAHAPPLAMQLDVVPPAASWRQHSSPGAHDVLPQATPGVKKASAAASRGVVPESPPVPPRPPPASPPPAVPPGADPSGDDDGLTFDELPLLPGSPFTHDRSPVGHPVLPLPVLPLPPVVFPESGEPRLSKIPSSSELRPPQPASKRMRIDAGQAGFIAYARQDSVPRRRAPQAGSMGAPGWIDGRPRLDRRAPQAGSMGASAMIRGCPPRARAWPARPCGWRRGRSSGRGGPPSGGLS
jgi:hypothetical protein